MIRPLTLVLLLVSLLGTAVSFFVNIATSLETAHAGHVSLRI